VDRESTSASRLSAALLGAGSTAITAGAVLYLTKQDPGPDQPRYIRASGSIGIGVGTAGLAIAGTGLWLLNRESVEARIHAASGAAARKRSIPRVVSVTAGRSFVGAVGTF
jgi:hypothetical protein